MAQHILFVVALYLAFTHGLTSDIDIKGRNNPISNDDLKKYFSKDITFEELNDTINLRLIDLSRMSTHEKNLGYAAIEVAIGSPSHEQYIDSYPEPEAVRMMGDSVVALHVAHNTAYKYCNEEAKDSRKCSDMMKYLTLWNTSLSWLCQNLESKCIPKEINSSYRSYDGSCNNVKVAGQGQAVTIYGRILPQNYFEDIDGIRRSVTKAEMPSAQVISSSLYIDRLANNERSLAVLYWGQFIEHDFSHTAMSQMVHTGKLIECCNSEGRFNNPRYVHPFCLPIRVSDTDHYYKKRDITCLSYVRSIPGIGPECSLSSRNQLNQATHFLDASQIYGTTAETAKSLRSFRKGQLLESSNHALPISMGEDCLSRPAQKQCYRSGDKRVNGNPYITALYTLWHREHNRIASQLAEMNLEWDDETIFQEARRIVIAEIQHITYSEWIPEVLGLEINDPYVPDANPVVSNSFATAAIRALQSGGPEKITKVMNEERNKVERSQGIEQSLKLMTTEQYNGRSLNYFGHLSGVAYGIDILSFDIQRGRDHGLPTYNAFREYCGLKKAAEFKDLHTTMSPKTVESLQKNYKSVEDIDLIVGGIAEKSQKGVFGPTLSCILKEQFKRTRRADRYFYMNQEQPKPFSECQLEEIRKVTLARIICDNARYLKRVQRNIFRRLSKQNDAVECKSGRIPSLNLDMWNEK